VTEADVKAPAQMLMFGDGYDSWATFVFSPGWELAVNNGAYPIASESVYEYKQADIQRQHAGRMGLVFCDGHTEKPRMKAVFGVEHVTPVFATGHITPPPNSFPDLWLHRWNRDDLEH
jgi:prepilin-type processing-associated H-X9-DG protein